MIIGNKEFINGKTYVMGILNLTPDSFSDGGKYNTLDLAIAHAEEMIVEGVDIIDVGGESTRPGYVKVSDNEEIKRIVKVIEEIKKRFDIPISVDTYKSKVARAAISSGADMINDIWGYKYDDNMAEIVKNADVACCLMHKKSNAEYRDFISDAVDELSECVKIAKAAGISDDKIILDPGIGFGKTYEQN